MPEKEYNQHCLVFVAFEQLKLEYPKLFGTWQTVLLLHGTEGLNTIDFLLMNKANPGEYITGQFESHYFVDESILRDINKRYKDNTDLIILDADDYSKNIKSTIKTQNIFTCMKQLGWIYV